MEHAHSYLLTYLFTWARAPQGDTYWRAIRDSNRALTAEEIRKALAASELQPEFLDLLDDSNSKTLKRWRKIANSEIRIENLWE